ncbi:MAG: helix-turn-helix domain-containing protein [Dehalococcoidia bacterium]|nr:MAG: helix-turn-helix domain-containing protein [Dehalococcoidia bacterium]
MNGQIYYRTAEICQQVKISRATLYRWLRAGILEKAYRDRRGWRLFTKEDLEKLLLRATEVQTEYAFIGK